MKAAFELQSSHVCEKRSKYIYKIEILARFTKLSRKKGSKCHVFNDLCIVLQTVSFYIFEFCWQINDSGVNTISSFRACSHGGGEPQVGGATRLGGVTRLSI